MTYLLITHWAALLLIFLIGLSIGWWSAARPGASPPLSRGVGWGLVGVFLFGCLLAIARAFANETGYWFDLITLALAIYLAGCVLGGLFSARRLGFGDAALATAAGSGGPRAPVERVGFKPAWELRKEGIEPPASPPKSQQGTASVRPEVERVGFLPEWELRQKGVEPPVSPPKPPAAPATLRPEVERVNFAPEWELRKRAEAQEAATPAPAAPPAELAFDDDDPTIVAAKPSGLAAPRGGRKDNLQRIRGIGRVNEAKLNELGIWHFDQIGAWDSPQAKWVNSFLAFPGRIQREEWIVQARALARGEETAFSKRVDAGEVATSDSKKSV